MAERIGTLDALCRYPVKSMAGERLEEVFVGFAGVMEDRAWAFVRTGARRRGFPWHTGREQENLVCYRPRYRDAVASRLPVEIEASLAMPPGANPVFPGPDAFAVDVTLPDGRTVPVDSAELVTELGGAVQSRFSERGLYDCRPVSLFGNASARAIGLATGRPVDRRRFRANLYAEWDDDRPFHEDGLVGRTLQIGERLRIAVLERDPRCKMITLDPDTGAMDVGPLRYLAQSRDAKAGVYAAVLVQGIVRAGDPIALV